MVAPHLRSGSDTHPAPVLGEVDAPRRQLRTSPSSAAFSAIPSISIDAANEPTARSTSCACPVSSSYCDTDITTTSGFRCDPANTGAPDLTPSTTTANCPRSSRIDNTSGTPIPRSEPECVPVDGK